DGRTLAAGGFWCETLRLFDLTTRRLTQTIPNTVEGQNRWSREWQGPTVAFSPDGRTLIVGGKDGALHLWETATGRAQGVLRVTAQCVVSLTLAVDGRSVLTAHSGGVLHRSGCFY